MKRRLFLCAVISVCSLLVLTQPASAQATEKTYQQMTVAEQEAFVREQAVRLAREISGRNYEFTPEFIGVIQKNVDSYAKRVGSNARGRIGRTDLRLVVERGQMNAATIGTTFAARNLSPLLGIYLPMIESEYQNVESPFGALGMFQFLPATGSRYGLSKEELLDMNKSADAAARYLSDGIFLFKHDPMKEALALLAYNRGSNQVVQELAQVLTKDTESCSICALTAASAQLDPTFQNENVYYVPRFFAAAIVGENPSRFGLSSGPLSSYR